MYVGFIDEERAPAGLLQESQGDRIGDRLVIGGSPSNQFQLQFSEREDPCEVRTSLGGELTH